MSSTTRCIICVMPIFSFNLSALYCGHTFHLRCIVTWLNNSANCPICRREISVRDPIKPLFVREGRRDQYRRNHYPTTLQHMYQRKLNGSSATDVQNAYFSGGILLRYLLQKFYDFELNSILWRKAAQCPICLKTLLVKDTYHSQCGHSLHRYCFEKWIKIDKNCPVCRKKAMLETIDNDLLEILSDENPPRNRNNANEAAERESDKLIRENTASHLKIMHAVMLLDAALKL